MRMRSGAEELAIDGPAGRLEAMLEQPGRTALRGSVVVCHPHPLHGGTMHNKVVHTLARSFLDQGFAALRFNFRGTGASEGRHDNGEGEIADVLSALRWMEARQPGLPLWMGGFSFGAAMAIRAAATHPVAGLVTVAPASTRFAGGLAIQPDCPWLIIHGDADEIVSIDETIAWVNSLAPGPELDVFADAGHFFHGRLVELRQAVSDFIGRHA